MSTDFQTIRSGVNPGSPKWLRAAQAEALVPETINFQHLAYISFVNELSVQQAREMNGGRHNLNFTVKPILFVDDPNVNSVPSYSILHSANFPNCKENDDELIFDRTIEENLFVVLTISTRGSYNLMLSVREVGHKASYKGSYSGQISIRFKISSLTLRNGINTLDVDLNGSFWRRKIVVVEC